MTRKFIENIFPIPSIDHTTKPTLLTFQAPETLTLNLDSKTSLADIELTKLLTSKILRIRYQTTSTQILEYFKIHYLGEAMSYQPRDQHLSHQNRLRCNEPFVCDHRPARQKYSSVLDSMQIHDGQVLKLEALHRSNFAPNEPLSQSSP